jgi:hypothetical protein
VGGAAGCGCRVAGAVRRPNGRPRSTPPRIRSTEVSYSPAVLQLRFECVSLAPRARTALCGAFDRGCDSRRSPGGWPLERGGYTSVARLEGFVELDAVGDIHLGDRCRSRLLDSRVLRGGGVVSCGPAGDQDVETPSVRTESPVVQLARPLLPTWHLRSRDRNADCWANALRWSTIRAQLRWYIPRTPTALSDLHASAIGREDHDARGLCLHGPWTDAAATTRRLSQPTRSRRSGCVQHVHCAGN